MDSRRQELISIDLVKGSEFRFGLASVVGAHTTAIQDLGFKILLGLGAYL